ncbi:lanthionine synthetase LanC family protein [Weissella sp. MSCH1]|uniref:lanthionine synthetase LanC family protein n=1 Tax=Weissella sp. MSCH1 TaxID=3383343 RepID=UPI003896DC93
MALQRSKQEIIDDLSSKLVHLDVEKDLTKLAQHGLKIQYDHTEYDVWQENSLMGGRFGILSMMLRIDEFDEAIFKYQFNNALKSVNPKQGLSIFDGLAGVGNTMIGTKKYDFTNVVSQIELYIDKIINDLSNDIPDSMIEHGYGLAGIGQFYLQRYDVGENVVKQIISLQNYYISRFGDDTNSDNLIKDWAFSTLGQETRDINLSVSHGLAGVMIFLIDSTIRVGSNQKLDNLITKIGELISKYSIWDETNNFRLYATNLSNDTDIHNVVRNDSWCYGTSGFEIAMLKYAIFNKDTVAAEKCLQSLKYVIEHSAYVRSFSICHGLAGLVFIGNIVNNALGYPYIDVSEAEERIIAGYTDDDYFGYADHKLGVVGDEDNLTTDLGMLTGVSGILYALSEPNYYNAFEYAMGMNMTGYEFLV